MNNPSIQQLIDAHKTDNQRLENEKTLSPIKVSRAVSFLAVLYEKMRNAVEYEEVHLLRKRAIKRILLRIAALKDGDPHKLAETVIIEIILAQYLTEYNVPLNKIDLATKIIKKYQTLINTYKSVKGKKLKTDMAEMVYSLCAFEIERILVPYTAKDALVNAQYNLINSLGIISSENLPKQSEPIQNYIAAHRAIIKSDNDIISFHLFYLKFPFWNNPQKDHFKVVAQNLDSAYLEIMNHLNYRTKKSTFREIIRQSIPFKILDKVISNNITQIEDLADDKDKLEEQIELVCNEEYKENKRKLQTTIIRSIIYIFITKIMIALVVEVPYELKVEGQINFLTLGINILFPVTTMFIVANSFTIPNEKNTKLIKDMVKAIISPNKSDDAAAFKSSRKIGYTFKVIFQTIYFGLFFTIFGGILYLLYLLNFNIVGMFVFVIFFSTIFFVSVRLRNTASELRVVNSRPSVFAPIIDMFAAPILMLGKNLSEGASQFNFLTLILDFFIEAPFKTIIKVVEDWSTYIRETREEIV